MRSPAEVAAMSCPVCRVPLAMSDRQGVEIDYCPQCRGVWLDRGELDKIIDRSVSAPAVERTVQPPPSPQGGWGDRERGYDRKPYKKQKSWLSDLFD